MAVCLISVVYRWTINCFSPSLCTQSFMHSLASNCNGYVLKRKIMLFSCWIRKLIKCQRWIFNSVSSWMWPCKWWPVKQLWNTVWKIQLFSFCLFRVYAKAWEVATICHFKVFYHKVATFTSVTHTDKQNKTFDISEKIMVEIVVVVFAMQKHTDSDS